MIIVITDMYRVLDSYGLPTGKKELLVSHGVDTETNKTVIMPNVPPEQIGCRWDRDIGEYIL